MTKDLFWYRTNDDRNMGMEKTLYTEAWAKRVAKNLEKGLGAEVEVVDMGYGNFAIRYAI